MAPALTTGWPAVLAGAPLPAVLLDDTGAVVWANVAAEALLGRRAADLAGRDGAEALLPARLHEEHRAGLRRLGWAGGPGTAERRTDWPVVTDAGERTVDLHVVRTGDDPPFAMLLEDRSELRALEADLRRTRGLLSDASRLADVGTWEWDLAADRLAWSEELHAIAGRDVRSFTPSIDAFLDIVHPDDREDVRAAIRLLVEDPAVRSFRARVVRPGGEVRHVVVTQQPAATDGAAPTRFFGVVRDVTGDTTPAGTARALVEGLGAWERCDEGARALARRIGEVVGWFAVALWLPDPDTGEVRLRAFWTEEGAELDELEAASRAGELVPGTGIAGRAWSLGTPVVVRDIASEPDFRRRGPALRGGVVGVVAIPAVADGEVLAVLEGFCDDPHLMASLGPELLALVGAQTGAVLARSGRRLARPPLSQREREVLQLAADGLGVGKIAERLVVSPATVKTHFQNVFDKLGTRDRAAAVAEGMRLGLIV